MSIESEPRNPRLLRRERRRGKMCGSSKRDFDVGCRFRGVMATPVERTSLTPRYTANALARKEKEGMYRDDEEARSAAAPSKGESAT